MSTSFQQLWEAVEQQLDGDEDESLQQDVSDTRATTVYSKADAEFSASDSNPSIASRDLIKVSSWTSSFFEA